MQLGHTQHVNHIVTTETDQHIVSTLRKPEPFDWALYVTRHGMSLSQVAATPMSWAAYLCILGGRRLPPVKIPQKILMAKSARINISRWIIDCPFCDVAGIASKKSPYFWCPKCYMATNGYDPIIIAFPANALEIERLLLLRPDPQTRNWYPTETIDDLRRENIAHGIGV